MIEKKGEKIREHNPKVKSEVKNEGTEDRSRREGGHASSCCCGKCGLEGQREISSSEAVGTAGNQDNPSCRLPQKYWAIIILGSKRSQGRESRVGTWQSKRSTKSGRQRVLGPGEGSAETVDHGKLASQLQWEVDATVGKRKVERWGRRDSGTGRYNESKRPELKPKAFFPTFPFFFQCLCIITLGGRPYLCHWA